MTHAIIMNEAGGPDVLKWQAVDTPEPGPGQIRIHQTAVGLNYIDCYHRSGLYPLDLPASIGMEAAGMIDAIG
ncbi:MAG: quinone oxidoreductase, partial [Rhodospirillaceae bacterium]|nr:quinone oxidoreductase [Rhodospirillaceae bacterium]